MGVEEREARPDRQDRRHQQAGPEIQGRRRPAAAPETSRTGPGILRRSAPALYHRITGISRPTYALLSIIHRPAHDSLRVTVDHGRQIYAAFPGFNIGDVPDHFQARSARGEVALDEVDR